MRWQGAVRRVILYVDKSCSSTKVKIRYDEDTELQIAGSTEDNGEIWLIIPKLSQNSQIIFLISQ